MSPFPSIRKLKIKSTPMGGRAMAPEVGHVLVPGTPDSRKWKRRIKTGKLTLKQGHCRGLFRRAQRNHECLYKWEREAEGDKRCLHRMVREATQGALKAEEESHELRDIGYPRKKLEEGKWSCPWSLQTQSCSHFDFGTVRPCPTSNLQNCKIIIKSVFY